MQLELSVKKWKLSSQLSVSLGIMGIALLVTGVYGYHIASTLLPKADDAVKATLWGGAQASNLFLLIMLFGFFAGAASATLGLRKILNDVKQYTRSLGQSSLKVKALAQRLSDSNMQLSANATETASSLEETVASLEELSSMISLNTENSKKVYSVSESTKHIAEAGEKNILSLTLAMEEIKKDSKKMEDIVNVIDDISFQTNLLALNAAVEAARAGEQGKGFAVVADAVRSLAQRSSTSAKEINLMIRESLSKVERGSDIATDCNKSLNQIFEQVKQVTELSGQIAQASQEQTSGLKQINQAMTQLDLASQDNAAAAENVLRASTDTQDQSSHVLEIINAMEHFVFGHAENRNFVAAEVKPQGKKAPRPQQPVRAALIRGGTTPTSRIPQLATAMPLKFEPVKASTNVVSFAEKRPVAPVTNVAARKPGLNMGLEPKDNRIKKVENF